MGYTFYELIKQKCQKNSWFKLLKCESLLPIFLKLMTVE